MSAAVEEEAALRRLGGLKLRAAVRKQARRLRTPRGMAFAFLGGALFFAWFGSLFLWSGFSEREAVAAEDVLPLLRLGTLFFFGISLFGSLQHRGLYLPAEEIERLFSAPLSRPSVTRYRIRATLTRVLPGAALVGLVVTRRAPVPLHGFLGALSAIGAATVAGQTAAILAGAVERRLPVRWLSVPARIVFLLFVVGGTFVFWAVFVRGDADGATGAFGRFLRERLQIDEGLAGLLGGPLTRAVTAPLEPWARAMAAETPMDFAGWFPLTLLLGWGLYELTARLPIDYRELSLQTSASVAERLRRFRRVGGGASASRVSRRTRSVRVPFLFGRGPFGAVAWRKSVEILRKARGTLWVSSLVLVLLLFVSGLVAEEVGPEEVVVPSAVLTSLGILYLCSGLRFDFRDDLDRMATIRSWPLAPTTVFVATILPEIVLVTVLLWTALAVRVALGGVFQLGVLAVAATVPPAAFAWLALDNVVFLFAPVRFVPGQEGALQNAGRLVVLLFLRVLGALVLGALVVGAGAGAWFGVAWLGAGEAFVRAAAFFAGWLVLAGAGVFLALLGGLSYSRFDPAQ